MSNDRKPDEYKYELEMCEHYYIDEDEVRKLEVYVLKLVRDITLQMEL